MYKIEGISFETEVTTEDKARNMILDLIKHSQNMQYEIDILKDHINDVQNRKKSLESKQKDLKSRAAELMSNFGMSQCKDAFVTISKKRLPPSYTVVGDVPEQFMKTETKQVLNKDMVQEEIMNAGEDVDWLDQDWSRTTISARFK